MILDVYLFFLCPTVTVALHPSFVLTPPLLRRLAAGPVSPVMGITTPFFFPVRKRKPPEV